MSIALVACGIVNWYCSGILGDTFIVAVVDVDVYVLLRIPSPMARTAVTPTTMTPTPVVAVVSMTFELWEEGNYFEEDESNVDKEYRLAYDEVFERQQDQNEDHGGNDSHFERCGN